MRLTCPKCETVVEGDLARVEGHVKRCGKAVAAKAAKAKMVERDKVMPAWPVVVRVPMSIASQNASQYDTWHTYSKIKRAWDRTLSPILSACHLDGLWFNRSFWSITRLFASPEREFDYANLVGGTKPIPDVLIRCGVIVDDSPKHFHCDYSQQSIDSHPEAAELRRYGIRTIIQLKSAEF